MSVEHINSAENVSDYLLSFIDPHWFHFDPIPKAANYALAIVIGFVAVVSVVGNGIVIYVFGRSNLLRKANFYVINLALSDCLMAGATYWMFVWSSMSGIWQFGKLACELYGFTQGFCSIMSIVTIAVIAMERVYGIEHPNSTLQISYPTKLGITVLIWAYCFAVCSPPLSFFGWSRYTAAGFKTTCCFEYLRRDWITRSYIIYLFVLGFCVPMFYVVYSFGKILHFANVFKDLEDNSGQERKSSLVPPDLESKRSSVVTFTEQLAFRGLAGIGESSEKLESAARRIWMARLRLRRISIRTEIKTARIILIATMFFLMAWTPYSILVLVGQFAPEGFVQPWMSQIPSVFAKVSVLYNPFIYGLKDYRFKQAVKKFIVGLFYQPYRVIRLSLRYSRRSFQDSFKSKRERNEINVKRRRSGNVSFNVEEVQPQKEIQQTTELT